MTADLSEGRILPGDGRIHYHVHYRMLAFRPHIGEIINGHVTRSTGAGTYVRIGSFFEDIFIPSIAHPDGSEFNAVENTWIWKYNPDGDDQDNDEAIKNDAEGVVSLPMNINEPIRLRVRDEVFEQISPEDEAKGMCPPYTIIGSINELKCDYIEY